MDFQKELSVKSYCFREFKDAGVLARMVRDCGVDRLDISRVHLDFDSVESQKRVIGALGDAGVKIVGLGVVTFTGDESTDRKFFEFCRLAGCRTISMSFEPADQSAVLANVGKLSAEYGMRCAIHNHGGKHWLGNKTMLDHLFTIAPPALGLCMDTAWAIQAGENPVAWAKAVGAKLMATHLKDFTFDRHGEPSDTILGEGALDLPAYLNVLRESQFDGPFVIEYEGDAMNPVPALQKCVEIVRSLLEGVAP